ncbi:MAG: hypothetical protein RIQ74_1601, partial [Pseudomonadota bacterium]
MLRVYRQYLKQQALPVLMIILATLFLQHTVWAESATTADTIVATQIIQQQQNQT